MRLPVWKRKPMVGEVIAEAEEIVRQSAWDDTFLRLIEQYEPAVRRLTGVYLERQTDREDLFQEIAVALWQAIPKFRGESSERTWLYRIAHNVAISSAARAHRRRKTEEPISEEFEYPSSATNAEQLVLRKERRRALVDSLRSLPATDRQIILLHLEGLSYAEIEEVSGLSEIAIATRLTRIRGKLKEEIQRKEVGTREQSG